MVYSYYSLDVNVHSDVGLYSDDVSVLRSKMSDVSSSLDVDGDNDTSLYRRDVSTPKLSDHEMSQHANVVGDDVKNVSLSLDLDADSDTALYSEKDASTPKPSDNETLEAAPVENVSLSLYLDADTDAALYGENDVSTPKLSDNETSEAAPDGQKQILIEAEIDSEASQDESTPMFVTQTQALPPADADKDAIIVPNPLPTLPLRHYTPIFVKAYPTNKGAQYWSDEIPDPVFPVWRETNFKPPYANWKGKFKNML
jgi:hypothetical protein